MVVGGNGALYDVEVLNLADDSSECFKPKNCPLARYSVGTFLNGRAMVCEEYQDKYCAVYDEIQDKWTNITATNRLRSNAEGILLTDDLFWILGLLQNEFCQGCNIKCNTIV